MRRGESANKRLDFGFYSSRRTERKLERFPSAPLKALVSFVSGGTPSKSVDSYWQGNIPWVSPKDFGPHIISNSEDYISEAGRIDANLKMILPGSVLIVVRSGVLQHTLPVALVGQPLTINQDIKALTPINRILDGYLASFFEVFNSSLLSRAVKHSTTVQSLNTPQLNELEIPLPPLDVQERLVAELDDARAQRQQKLAAADELIPNADARLMQRLGVTLPNISRRAYFGVKLSDIGKRLDAYANQEHFKRLFIELHAHHCPVDSLGFLAEKIFSGTTPTAGGAAYTDSEDGVRFIRSGKITKDGLVSETSAVYLNRHIHESSMLRSQLQMNDVLIAIVGATIGAVGVFTHDEDANINQAIAAVRLKPSQILPEYLRWYLSSPLGQMLLDYYKRPVARANINLEEIASIPIMVPTPDVQEEIIFQVRDARNEARRLRADAESIWQNAKARFEAELLGEEGV